MFLLDPAARPHLPPPIARPAGPVLPGQTDRRMLAASAQGIAYGHELERRGYPVTSIRRWLTDKARLGSRTATKQAVIEAVRARGYEPAFDNQADALALPLYTQEMEYEAGRLAREA